MGIMLDCIGDVAQNKFTCLSVTIREGILKTKRQQ